MASLIDTNVLVYRYDSRFPEKQRMAKDLLRRDLPHEGLFLSHQAIVEFIAVVTRPLRSEGGRSLLPPAAARREAEEMLNQFELLYPTEGILRTAFRGVATYQLSWFDAHLWAYAEFYGVPELISEDFQHGRLYGNVRVVNPFLPSEFVHESPATYG